VKDSWTRLYSRTASRPAPKTSEVSIFPLALIDDRSEQQVGDDRQPIKTSEVCPADPRIDNGTSPEWLRSTGTD
jgi:hypothetical protein